MLATDGKNAPAGFPPWVHVLAGAHLIGPQFNLTFKGDHEMENDSLPNQMKRRVKRQKGVTVVEYALMLALVAIAVALATPNIASAVISVFSKASSVMAK
jgi:Flp pilus assembly pilin Flp